MPCGCGGRISRAVGNKDPVVDIERLLVDYAWNELFEPSLWDRVAHRVYKRFQMDVNWSYFDVSHRVVDFKCRTAPDLDLELPGSDGAKPQLKGYREMCLFRTEFVNSSTLPQFFTFKTERTTTSQCSISLQRGYRIGANVDVRFTLPLVSIQAYYTPCLKKAKLLSNR